MVGSLSSAVYDTQHPNVRQIEPWRDGRQLAGLLEAAFAHDAIDASGHRMIDMLRNYGQFEPMTFGFGTSFVWVEEGRLLGNASIQRNPMRRDTWIIGNVATDAAYRGRGIALAVMHACLGYAQQRSARSVALQVDRGNDAAVSLYRKLLFEATGEVTYYLRQSVRNVPINPEAMLTPALAVRAARWSDKAAVWRIARENIPEALTYSEPFDGGVYRLGLRWSLFNSLNGNPERWFILARTDGSDEPVGGARTRVNIEGTHHHLELMLGEDVSIEHGAALLERALARFEPYISKPVYAAQSLPHENAHAALARVGFSPARNLIHMRLDL
jgi:GNAT superfamily N-acetyltransferase